ncbi:hypothetical protein [Candidatus Enterococcus courvalinii]|uniref:Uncharacterized protein n=1 Tax=Candidatus Enterococcus courvalinii TaxID=2815329 RepID=A0ABS3I0X7_9ENTE|nr:hypothetical protein [Enterococcus sp. MSG2901]MBO0481812.1 hypothetical protein [Enterococcus sp. MSG2901]
MNPYIKKAMIALENGNTKEYELYMRASRTQRKKRQAISEKWEGKQKTFLRKNYQKMTDKELSHALGKTIDAVKFQRKKLKLYKYPDNRTWKPKDIEFLKANYQKMSLKELAEKLNRKPKQISYKISKLGLSKHHRYRMSINGHDVAEGTIREIAEQIDANVYTVKNWRTSGISWAKFEIIDK